MARSGIIRIRIGLTPSIEALSQLLETGLAEAADWMPLWPLIVARLIEGIKRIIDSEGGEIAGYLSYGHAWFPADSRYLRRKQREGHGSVDLLYSGRLISQITTVAGVRRCTPRQLIFGTRGLKYVQLLNFVKRPFFGMSQSMESEVADLMSGYLSQVANRACRAAGGAR